MKARVKIITSVPPELGHCTQCEILMRNFNIRDNQRKEMPEFVIKESEGIIKILEKFYYKNPKEVIQLISIYSIEGILYSLRYRIKRTPAIIINNKKVHEGEITDDLLHIINELI